MQKSILFPVREDTFRKIFRKNWRTLLQNFLIKTLKKHKIKDIFTGRKSKDHEKTANYTPRGIQLELNFNGINGNRFKEHLDNGDFTVLIETHAPPGNIRKEDARDLGTELEYTVSARTKIFSALAFTGSSVIIIVGVVLETAREIESQMTMRHYKGFLE